MRNSVPRFTMRKDGVLPQGDWFRIENKAGSEPTKVYIYDEIGFWGTEASEFTKQLVAIEGDIDLHVNSPGGEIFDGLAIYASLKQHKGKVVAYVDGLAASAASFIVQAADEIVMSRFAQMMIHDGIAFAYGNEADMIETASLLGRLSDNIADIYQIAAKARGDADATLEYYRGLMRAETWMNGQEAVDFKLADSVTETEDEEEASKATAKWDLTKCYNFAGRDFAESPSRVAARAMLMNKKENEMGDAPSAPQATTDPEVTPAPVPEGTPPPEPETPAAPAPETPEAPTPETPAAPEQPVPANSTQGVMINGQLVTDWTVINRHFAAMNTAAAEQQATHRRASIEKLANDNKIPATQVDSLVDLVNGSSDGKITAMSEPQYAAFMASYESLPASPLFAPHAATGQSNQPGFQFGDTPAMTAEQAADRRKVLEGIVDMNRRTMTQERLENTASYIELQSLLDNNKS